VQLGLGIDCWKTAANETLTHFTSLPIPIRFFNGAILLQLMRVMNYLLIVLRFQSPSTGQYYCNSCRLRTCFGRWRVSVPFNGAILLQYAFSFGGHCRISVSVPFNGAILLQFGLMTAAMTALSLFQSPSTGQYYCNDFTLFFFARHKEVSVPFNGAILLQWRKSCSIHQCRYSFSPLQRGNTTAIVVRPNQPENYCKFQSPSTGQYYCNRGSNEWWDTTDFVSVPFNGAILLQFELSACLLSRLRAFQSPSTGQYYCNYSVGKVRAEQSQGFSPLQRGNTTAITHQPTPTTRTTIVSVPFNGAILLQCGFIFGASLFTFVSVPFNGAILLQFNSSSTSSLGISVSVPFNGAILLQSGKPTSTLTR
jgi:hypothetical protein